MIPLSYANPGEEAIIRKIGGSPEVRKHLENLGFVVGGTVTVITSSCFFRRPSFFSTVTPGQFPTNWADPVNALNRVVLPLFGLPARAMRSSISRSSL